MELLLDNLGAILPVLVLIVVAILLVNGITSRYQRVPPNMAMLVFGRGQAARVIVSGGKVIWPVVEEAKYLSIGLMTIDIPLQDIYTKQGVKVEIDSVGQVKIRGDETAIKTAAEQFLGKSEEDIRRAALLSLEGHLRAIVGTMSIEELYQDRDAFVQRVQEVAAKDLDGMGLHIVSLTIKNVSNPDGYFEALGRPMIAAVKRDAEIGEAEAQRESRLKVATTNQDARQAELEAQARIAEAEKDLSIQQSAYKVDADTKRAEAERAFDLKDSDIKKELATKNGAVAVEQQRQAGLAAQEAVVVAEKTQRGQVIVPAQAQKEAAIEAATAEAQRTKLAAAAEAERVRLTRTAEAEGIRATGTAEADAQKAKLLAEAEGERELAAARSAQGEVNLRQFAIERTLEAQVQMVQALSGSLVGIGANMKVVQFAGGDGGGGAEHNALLSTLMQIPELATVLNAKTEALADVNLGGLLQRVASLVSLGSEADPKGATGGAAQIPAE